MADRGPRDGAGRGDGGGAGGGASPGAAGERLVRLLGEFRRRQRRSPELVVRPWWAPGPGGVRAGGARGFVVEYSPDGVRSVELAVRRDRARLEGPVGTRELSLDLGAGWILEGRDTACPETLANHLLSRADRLLGEAA